MISSTTTPSDTRTTCATLNTNQIDIDKSEYQISFQILDKEKTSQVHIKQVYDLLEELEKAPEERKKRPKVPHTQNPPKHLTQENPFN